MPNDIARILGSDDPSRIKLDHQVKRVLAIKPILARIISGTVEECKGMTEQEIMDAIEGDILVEEAPVEPWDPVVLEGSPEESYLPGEGVIRYDIRTFLRLPGRDELFLAKILLDVEAQKDENPGYDIPVRGVYYCCRMISEQNTRVFSTGKDDPLKYGRIQKVYSIWICTETSKKRANSIEKYALERTMLCGTTEDVPRYDLMSVIVINLPKDHDCGDTDNGLLRFLNDLFNDTMGREEKLHLLEEKHHLNLTEDNEKEVDEMCSYATAVLERGLKEGRQEGRQEGEAKLTQLLRTLLDAGRTKDVEKAISDEEARKAFYREFGMID